jgi:hypothetical protein
MFDQNRPYIEILVDILNKDRIPVKPICRQEIDLEQGTATFHKNRAP